MFKFTCPSCGYSPKVCLQKPFACHEHFPYQRPLLKNKTVGEFLDQNTLNFSSANFSTLCGILWTDLISPFVPGNFAIKRILKLVKIISSASMQQYAFLNPYIARGYSWWGCATTGGPNSCCEGRV